MIIKTNHCEEQIGSFKDYKKISIISKSSEQDLSLQAQSFHIKKNHLSSLVEKVNLNSIEDMISSPRKRKNSQKQCQPISRKCSTHYSQNSPRSSPQKMKNTFFSFQTLRNAVETRKKSEHAIQNAEQQFQIKVDKEDKCEQNHNLKTKILNSAFVNGIDLGHKPQKYNLQMIQISITNETLQDFPNKPQTLIVEQLISDEKNQTPIQSKELKRSSEINLNDFDEITLLGVGVYGRVSLARHKQTKMLVALKKIQKDTLNAQDSIYLSRQIKIQSFAQHPNIVQLYTFFNDQQNIYLVLEVCNEGNLYDLLQKSGGKFSEEKTKKYIRQICKAVQFLHNHQIIHRDLKPENILVHNGVAKICDFGWAVYTPQLRHTLCGTPLYSSPEIIKREKYDSKIDIWNIGIMTYQFVFGKVPFDIKNCEDLHKIVDTEIEFPDDESVSQNCRNFIRGCLQKVPQDRFEIWELLRHPFINIEQKIRQSLMLACTSYQT